MEGIALKIHKLGIGKHLKPLQLSLGKRKDYICKKMGGGGLQFSVFDTLVLMVTIVQFIYMYYI